MLKFPGGTITERTNPPTEFHLFQSRNFMGSSDLTRLAQKRGTSRPRNKVRINDNANEEESDSITISTAKPLSPLPANEELARAISEVPLPMDGWYSPHVYKLFAVLVQSPSVGGLDHYLAKLQEEIKCLKQNGLREVVSHCWYTLQSKRLTPNLSPL